jgi:DNA-binding transcriptional MerR regulator
MANAKTPALTEAELAERWNLSIKTLQYWRRLGTGPDFVRLNNKAIRYLPEVIDEYESNNSRVRGAA